MDKAKYKRIDLPFGEAKKLTTGKIEKLIVLQARRIPIMDWETELLLKLCKQKRCMDNGLAVMYEYASHLDEVREATYLRSKAAKDLFHRRGGSEDPEVESLLIKLAELNIRTLIAVGKLRTLQYSPKTILTDLNITNVQVPANSRVSLEAALREEARRIGRMFLQPVMRLPEYARIFLLGTVFTRHEMEELLSESTSYEAIAPLHKAITNILYIEDDITTAYKVIRASIQSTPNTAANAYPFNEFPVLRIAYIKYTPPKAYHWFAEAVDVYRKSMELIGAFWEDILKARRSFGKGSDLAIESVKGTSQYAPTEFFDKNGMKMNYSANPQMRQRVESQNNFHESEKPSYSSKQQGEAYTTPARDDNKGSPNLDRPRPHTMHSIKDAQPRRDERQESITPIGKGGESPFHQGRKSFTRPGSGRPYTSPKPNRRPSKNDNTQMVSQSQSFLSASEGPALSQDVNYIREESRIEVVVEDPGTILQMTPSSSLSGPINVPQVQNEALDDPLVVRNTGATPLKSPQKSVRDRVHARNQVNSKKQKEKHHKSIKDNDMKSAGHIKIAKQKEINRSKKMMSIKSRALISSKSQHLLSFLNFTKPLSPGEAKASGQALHIALKGLHLDGMSLVKVAARKIAMWWLIAGPRVKLRKRQRNTQMVRGLVIDIVHIAALVVAKKMRTKAHLLRNGAAITIQRLFKSWFYGKRKRTVPHGGWVYQKRIRELQRLTGSSFGIGQISAPQSITELSDSDIFGVAALSPQRPYPFSPPKSSENLWPDALDSGGSHNPHILRRGATFSEGLSKGVAKQKRRRKLVSNSSHGAGMTYDKSLISTDRKRKAMTKFRAAIIITGFMRILKCKRTIVMRKEEKKAARKRMFTFSPERAAIMIQCTYRCFNARRCIYRRVYASMLIHNAWRKYIAMRRLRMDLRRREKPFNIKLRGLRGLPYNMGSCNGIKVKVSAFWSGLLHIFQTKEEVTAVIRGRKPQWIKETDFFPLMKDSRIAPEELEQDSMSYAEAEDISVNHTNSRRRSSLSRGLDSVGYYAKKLGSKILPGNELNKKPTRNPKATEDNDPLDPTEIVYQTIMDGVEIRIPALHGNSILKFEFFTRYDEASGVTGLDEDGVKYIGDSLFFFCMHGDLMFWGGEYSIPVNFRERQRSRKLEEIDSLKENQRRGRAAPLPTGIVLQTIPATLEFFMSTGRPMLARCGTCRIKMSGRGPMMSAYYRTHGWGIMLDTWKKTYLSFDGDYLRFFESKYSTDYFYAMSRKEMSKVEIRLGKPTSKSNQGIEDTHNVVLRSHSSNEEITFRFMDSSSRASWAESLHNACQGFGVSSSLGSRQNSLTNTDEMEDVDGNFDSIAKKWNMQGPEIQLEDNSKGVLGFLPIINRKKEEVVIRKPTGKKRRASAFAADIQEQLKAQLQEQMGIHLPGINLDRESDRSDPEYSATDSEDEGDD